MNKKNNQQVENSAQLSELSLQQEKRLNEKVTVKDIDEVYRRMTRLYGHKFTSSYGECDDGTWLMALQGLSRGDLTRGMTEMMNTPNEWPPSVPKFKQLCLGVKKEVIKNRAEILAIEECGGSFSYRQMTVNQCRSAIKEMLGQATKELMFENMEYSQKGELDSHLSQPVIKPIIKDYSQKILKP